GRRCAEYQDVLVNDEVPGLAGGGGFADVVELEEGRAGDQALAAEPGEQRDAPLGRDQAGARAGGEHGAGQVDQFAALPPGAGGGPAGAQQRGASGEDLGEPGKQVVQAVAGEVGGVVAVPVVVLLHSAAPGALLGADLPVDAAPVGRGGDHQRHPPGHARREQGGELAGVPADHLRLASRVLPAGAGDVRGGDVRPPGLVLDADGVAAEVDGLDQGGADAAHRVGDQVPGLAVAGDGGGGDRGQHLGGVGGGGGQVPAAALGPGVLLGGRPHRQRQGRLTVRAGAGGAGPGSARGAGDWHRVPPGWVKTRKSLWVRACTAAGPAPSPRRAAAPGGGGVRAAGGGGGVRGGGGGGAGGGGVWGAEPRPGASARVLPPRGSPRPPPGARECWR